MMSSKSTKPYTLWLALMAWALWVGLVCWAIIKNMGWVKALINLDHSVAIAAYTWNFDKLPICFLALSGVTFALAFMCRERLKFFGSLVVLSLGSAVGLECIQWYVTVFEHGRLVVRSVIVESDKIKKSLRLLHISDLEAADIGAHEINALVKASALNADLVIFTGDLIELQKGDDPAEMWGKLLPYLNKIQPKYGFYGVYGDGDQLLYRIPVSRDSTMSMLGVRPTNISEDFGLISIKGLSLYQSRYPGLAKPGIAQWLEGLSEDAFSIVVGHGPDYIPDVVEMPIDLCLAGHTHGGQVRLPWVGPLIVNSDIPRDWMLGFHEVGKTRFNVSAGIGSDRFRGMPIIRFGCPTEMTVIELRPAPSH